MLTLMLVSSLNGLESPDCPDVINLARGANMHLVNPVIFNQIQADCCFVSGIFCSGSPFRVKSIGWNSMGLNGSINGSALPDGLTSLYFAQNMMVGELPLNWPVTLIDIDFINNRLSGAITIPKGIVMLKLAQNLFTSFPASLPISLTLIVLFQNQLRGIFNSNWPTGLETLDLSGNSLSGDISQLPPSVKYLSISGGNKFTGTIRLDAPIQLFVQYNFISDIVVNSSSLLNCDISFNPLLNNPHISNLAICAKNGLYSASTLPKAVLKQSTTAPTPNLSQIITQKMTNAALTKWLSTPTLTNFESMQVADPMGFTPTNFESMQVAADPMGFTLTNFESIQVADPGSFTFLSTPTVSPIQTVVSTNTVPINDFAPWIIYTALGGFALVCILILIAGKLIKTPNVHSKFGRKNSFGTLNTINSTTNSK